MDEDELRTKVEQQGHRRWSAPAAALSWLKSLCRNRERSFIVLGVQRIGSVTAPSSPRPRQRPLPRHQPALCSDPGVSSAKIQVNDSIPSTPILHRPTSTPFSEFDQGECGYRSVLYRPASAPADHGSILEDAYNKTYKLIEAALGNYVQSPGSLIPSGRRVDLLSTMPQSDLDADATPNSDGSSGRNRRANDDGSSFSAASVETVETGAIDIGLTQGQEVLQHSALPPAPAMEVSGWETPRPCDTVTELSRAVCAPGNQPPGAADLASGTPSLAVGTPPSTDDRRTLPSQQLCETIEVRPSKGLQEIPQRQRPRPTLRRRPGCQSLRERAFVDGNTANDFRKDCARNCPVSRSRVEPDGV